MYGGVPGERSLRAVSPIGETNIDVMESWNTKKMRK